MYDPIKRRKYGRYTKEERMFQALVWTFVLLEVGAWLTACVTGGEWIARKVSVLDLISMLAVLVAAVLLSGQLRKVQDICQLSRDTQRLGALVLDNRTTVRTFSSKRRRRSPACWRTICSIRSRQQPCTRN
ncbi:unnamed protein product [Ectocarpus sp. 6 AP-2014]